MRPATKVLRMRSMTPRPERSKQARAQARARRAHTAMRARAVSA